MKRILIITVILSVFFISCSKDSTVIIPENEATLFSVNNNAEELKLRIDYPNQTIEFTETKNPIFYTLVASIKPNTINGNVLSASGISNKGNHVYLSFHTNGKPITGEILTLDVSNPNQVEILQSLTSNIFDFNDLKISKDQSKLWACGDELINNKSKAFAIEFPLNMNIPDENTNWKKNFDAYSGNSITDTYSREGEYLWITSGSNGGMSVFEQSNASGDAVFSINANDVKHFTAGREYGVLLIGQGNNLSTIRVFDLSSVFNYTDYEIPYDVTHLGKNGVHIDRNIAYLAMGDDGMVVFDLQQGIITGVFKSEESGYANSVYAEKEKIYIAYGSAGLYILDKRTLQSLGNWNYEGSCNYVCVDHGMVYVANGSGEGFFILKEN